MKIRSIPPASMPRVFLLLGLCLAHVASTPASVGSFVPGGDAWGGCWRERGTAGRVASINDPLCGRRLSLRGGFDGAAGQGSGTGRSRRTCTVSISLRKLRVAARSPYSEKHWITSPRSTMSLALISTPTYSRQVSGAGYSRCRGSSAGSAPQRAEGGGQMETPRSRVDGGCTQRGRARGRGRS